MEWLFSFRRRDVMSYWYIHASQRIRHTLQLRCGRFGDSPVKVTDAKTGQLKRWETTRGKPMAVMENGSLVLTKVGSQLGYKVRNNELVKT